MHDYVTYLGYHWQTEKETDEAQRYSEHNLPFLGYFEVLRIFVNESCHHTLHHREL